MAFVLADRVKETTIVVGTGAATLLGASSGYQSFSAGVGASNTTYYTIADQSGSNWEVGYGTLDVTGLILTRTTVISSSNSGSAVTFTTGTKDVWCDYTAKKAAIQDSLGLVTVPVLQTSSTSSVTPVLTFNGATTNYAAGAAVSGSYLQTILQNSSATAGASTNYVLSNNLGTDSTYYGEFGMNSSVYSASTPSDFFSINNGVYFSGHDGDITVGSGNGFKYYMAWGTAGQSAHVINASGAIGLSTNLGTTPALSGTTGFGTSGQVLTSAGNAAAPIWTTPTTGTVTSVTGTAPISVATGTTTPVISISQSTTSTNGYLSSTDWNTFNGKANAFTYTSNYIPYGQGTTTPAQSSALQFNGTTLTTTNDASISGLTVGKGGGAVASNTAVGNAALPVNTTGTSTSAFGQYAAYSNTTGSDIVAIGRTALFSNTTGNSLVAVGGDALRNNTTASYNTAVGYQAAYANTTGSYLTSVGWQSLYSNTTGVENVAMGRYTLGSNTTGGYNVAVGNQALINNTIASNNTAVGYQAGYSNTTGTDNYFAGYKAGYASVGSGNTFVGSNAGVAVNTYGSNAFFGYNSGNAVTTGYNNTIIGSYTGNNGGLDIRTASNYIVLSDGAGNPRLVVDGSGNFQKTGSGSATLYPAYSCRAWVKFTGTTINGSGNVSSVTKQSTGNYTVNMTNAMPDTGYCLATNGFPGIVDGGNVTLTTSAFNLRIYNDAGSYQDNPASVAVFR